MVASVIALASLSAHILEIVAELLGLFGRNLVALREGQRLRLLLDACKNKYVWPMIYANAAWARNNEFVGNG